MTLVISADLSEYSTQEQATQFRDGVMAVVGGIINQTSTSACFGSKDTDRSDGVQSRVSLDVIATRSTLVVEVRSSSNAELLFLLNMKLGELVRPLLDAPPKSFQISINNNN